MSHTNWRQCFLVIAIVATLGAWSTAPGAQELVPRAFWPSPKGTNLLVVGYQHSSGDVVTDPSLPIVGVESTVEYAQVTYQHTLSLFDRTANLQINLPYAWGSAEGIVEGEFRRRDLSALSDMRVLLSINLRGAPSMDMPEFQALIAKPKPIVGASLLIQPPTGGYDVDRFINTGTNRWSFKLAMGAIWPVSSGWLFEADVGAWFYGDNDEFVGTTRQQEPIGSAEFHLVRVMPDFWASLDLNYYVGGQTTVGEDVRADQQRNSRLGATVLIPF